MGIYDFRPEDAERFIASQSGKKKRRGNEVFLETCPYCKASGDDKYKFSINMTTGQFECKRASCGQKGNMITLSRDFGFSLGRDADAYYQTADFSTKQYKTFKDSHRAIETREPAVAYMEKRGIFPEIVKKYEITTKPDKDNILVFPFRDEEGALVFVKYRNTEFVKGKTDGSKEFCEANCKPILFGMNHCSGTGTLVITEGQIDSLSCIQAGIENAVSVPTGAKGFTWVPYCFNFVNRFNRIVVFGDCENGKVTLSEELSKKWPLKVKVVRQEDYRGCKDANELLQKEGPEALRAAVLNAEAPTIDCIKPIAKVQKVDIMKITCISTGIEAIDEVLDGGFRLGQLAILTGKRGEGKSTLASMWGVEALAQGFNSFFYSGELVDFYFRNWMDRQVTGKHEITKSDEDKLNLWYGDHAFIFDNTTISDENEKLLTAIEIAIVQKECKFVMIDNLMTALDIDTESDLYRIQSKFVGDLAMLAKKYEVFIILVAHPRKTNSGLLSNDDISGSSNITDRADIVMTYGTSNDDKEQSHRRLQITKNRLTGKRAEAERSIRLVYDQDSKRIAQDSKIFFQKRFSWEGIDPYNFQSVPDALADIIPF